MRIQNDNMLYVEYTALIMYIMFELWVFLKFCSIVILICIKDLNDSYTDSLRVVRSQFYEEIWISLTHFVQI